MHNQREREHRQTVGIRNFEFIVIVVVAGAVHGATVGYPSSDVTPNAKEMTLIIAIQ